MKLIYISAKFTLCLINVLILNIIIFFQKLLNKKIIIFYHPNQKLLKIHTYYIEKLFKKKNKYYVIYLHQNINFNKKSYFFVIHYFCRFIYNCNYFISNNVCDSFTPNSINIYIHHDIFDTPLVTKKKEKDLKRRLLKYDHILLASSLSKKIFVDLFGKKKGPNIEIIGYFKLDFLLNTNIGIKETSTIIIAPTDYKAFPEFSLYKDLKSIINQILKQTNLKVIFRPHPSNIGSKKVISLLDFFNTNKRVVLDTSDNYLKTYNSASLMITDISGTAYTYAFLTKKPVIFYCNFNKKFENRFLQLSYFKKRNIIGAVVRKKNFLSKFNKVLMNRKYYEKNINKIINENIEIGKTKFNLFEFIERN